MRRSTVVVLVGCWWMLLGVATAFAYTRDGDNWWPGVVRLLDDSAGRPTEVTALGPFFSTRETAEWESLSFRPLWTQIRETENGSVSFHVLYPLINAFHEDGDYRWHVLNLLRGSKRAGGAERTFEFWPFIFYRDAVNDDRDQFAVWPIGGTWRNFFGRKQVDFWAWPFYIRTEDDGEIRYSTPWPFIQTLTGEAHGFAFWPFYGHFERPGVYDHRFALWPLYYDFKDKLDKPVPYERFGILPFYARERANGLMAETFGWPFFGYTHEFDPRPTYDETRYFWPLLVQGRGEEKYVNRWMPLYSHERHKEVKRWWYLWPLFKRDTADLGFLTRERRQLLFFLYREELQYNESGFMARRQHLWPLYSYWNNGSGRRQLQALDPLTVFFSRNRRIQENWTSLFTLYRFDAREENSRHSLLWNFIVHESDGESTRLTVGPLYESEQRPALRRWSILKGLLAHEQTEEHSRWQVCWFNLDSSKP